MAPEEISENLKTAWKTTINKPFIQILLLVSFGLQIIILLLRIL